VVMVVVVVVVVVGVGGASPPHLGDFLLTSRMDNTIDELSLLFFLQQPFLE